MYVLSSSLRIPEPYLLLENSRPLSPWGPLEFSSTCLGNDSLNTRCSKIMQTYITTIDKLPQMMKILIFILDSN